MHNRSLGLGRVGVDPHRRRAAVDEQRRWRRTVFNYYWSGWRGGSRSDAFTLVAERVRALRVTGVREIRRSTVSFAGVVDEVGNAGDL